MFWVFLSKYAGTNTGQNNVSFLGPCRWFLWLTLKKMPKSNSPTRFINTASLASIISYTLPLLRINKGNWYVEFYAYDPLLHKQRRKRIKANRIKSVKSRRQYASGLKENEELLLVPLR